MQPCGSMGAARASVRVPLLPQLVVHLQAPPP
jgi:hypothetical protein